MTSFRFRLEKVLEWRRAQLDAEDARFRRSVAALAAVDRALAELEASAATAELELRHWGSIAGADLAALDEYRRHVRAEEQLLVGRRAERARELAAQEAAMLEARRRCRLLERLRERRWSEWKAAADREVEETAAESYLARWAGRR